MKDINTALYQMINLKLKNDYNICSGEKIFLPDIIHHVNKKYKKNILILKSKKINSLTRKSVKFYNFVFKWSTWSRKNNIGLINS